MRRRSIAAVLSSGFMSGTWRRRVEAEEASIVVEELSSIRRLFGDDVIDEDRTVVRENANKDESVPWNSLSSYFYPIGRKGRISFFLDCKNSLCILESYKFEMGLIVRNCRVRETVRWEFRRIDHLIAALPKEDSAALRDLDRRVGIIGDEGATVCQVERE